MPTRHAPLESRWRALLVSVAAPFVLAFSGLGCTLKADVAATGTAPATATHLAVTVEEVWLATGADTPPEASAGWVKTVLPAPVTIDLATLTPATLATLVSAASVPAGTYRQVHLVTADTADALKASASALGLSSNQEITLQASDGTLSTQPLESPVPGGGITIATDLVLAGSFSFGQSSTNSSTTGTTGATATTDTTGTTATTSTTGLTNSSSSTTTATLAVSLDAARDVLPYTYGTTTGYVLSPIATALDEKVAGAISGSVDASALDPGYGPISVSAEIPDATGSHHTVALRRVVGSGGSFSLYPLPAPSSGTTRYDIVISSSGANTVVIRGVPVAANPVTSPVVVQSTPILLTAATPVYANVSAQSTVLPGGARVLFYQTVTGSGETPYVVDGTAVDMVTRRLPGDAFALSNGPLSVGNYAGGDAIGFSIVAPVEGQGGYVVGTEGAYRADALAAAPSVVNGSSTASSPVLPPFPSVAAGGTAGTIVLTLTAPAGEFDSGFVIVSTGNRVIDTASVGTLLAAGGGTLNLTNLPAGHGLAPTAGVPYQLSVRAWNSASPAATLRRAVTTASVVLGDAGTGSAALELQ